MDGALLLSERLRLVRSDACPSDDVLEFFVRSVHHLEPWLPEAGPIASDPAFRAALYLHVEHERSEGREERWFFSRHEAPQRIVGYVFLTRLRRDGHRSCELSFGVDPQCQGHGLVREAAQRAILHAREDLGLTRVDARHAVDNTASARLLERLGFTRIGIAPQHAWVHGAWHDHVLLTLVDRQGPPH